MQPAKCNLLFAQFCYGGNGGTASVLPSHVVWWSRAYHEMKDDPRIDKIALVTLTDTPITMTRNKAVKTAKDGGYDMILMIDSDNQPDCELKSDPYAKPFWKTSFDFAYDRLQRGIPSVVCAPYCGPPPHENVYCFYWEGQENSPEGGFSLEPYARHAAASMTGIRPIAAGPTGVTLYTTSAFDLTEPPYFYYEYKDEPYCTEKASTEDVTNFRDINLNGQLKYGEPVVFCNWDSWAGHMKPKNVRKPNPIYSSDVNQRFRNAVLSGLDRHEKVIDLDFCGRMCADSEKDQPAEKEPNTSTFAHITDAGTIPGTDIVQYKHWIGSRQVLSVGTPTLDVDIAGLQTVIAHAVKQHPERPLKVLEVGSYVGETAVAICSAFGPAGGDLVCVDTWEGSPTDSTRSTYQRVGSQEMFRRFQENVNGLPVTAKKMTSSEASSEVEDTDFDVIFIDAGHDHDSVAHDIRAWVRHLAGDGILCGHDYSGAFHGVIDAVDEFCSAHGVIPRFFPNTSIWYLYNQDLINSGTVDYTNNLQESDLVHEKFRPSSDSNDTDGIAIKKRSILGRVITAVGHQNPLVKLQGIRDVVELLSSQKDGTAMRVLEVGTWVGESAVAITSGFTVDGSSLFCVDNFQGSNNGTDPINRAVEYLGSNTIRDYWKKNTEGLPVRLMEGSSLAVAAKITDKSDLDLVYIDASHDYEDVKADIQAWLPHVSPYGWMMGDDYGDSFPGVGRAIDELFADIGVEIRLVGDTGLWLVSKQEYLQCLQDNQTSTPPAQPATQSIH